jgi:hypothetical protein
LRSTLTIEVSLYASPLNDKHLEQSHTEGSDDEQVEKNLLD